MSINFTDKENKNKNKNKIFKFILVLYLKRYEIKQFERSAILKKTIKYKDRSGRAKIKKSKIDASICKWTSPYGATRYYSIAGL